MSSDVVLKVNNVGKRYEIYEAPHHRLFQTLFHGRKQFYKEFWALRDISFEVKRGECVGIIGRNGSGKSTLLQIIAGTLAPTLGEVEVKGRVSALLELGSGFNLDFTGRENVYMNGSILGLSKAQIDAKFDEIAAFADIGEFIEQPVKIYSSGMYIRLAFAIAINIDPDILIVDEALAVGDIRFQVKCFRKIEEFQEQRKTLLFVSHSNSDIVRLCKNVIWLDEGVIKAKGTAKTVVETYNAAMLHDTSVLRSSPKPTGESQKQLAQKKLLPISTTACITGDGGAEVLAVGFFGRDNTMIQSLHEAQKATLVFDVRTNVKLDMPWFAFQVLNDRGIRVLGSNSYVLEKRIPPILPNQQLRVKFDFSFPELANGKYLVSLGVADGTQDKHIRHQHIVDAYQFEMLSHSMLQKQATLLKLSDCTAEIDVTEKGRHGS
jgi:ABC-type polysaccharide/polyol phosphate transport system ATPase subunit